MKVSLDKRISIGNGRLIVAVNLKNGDQLLSPFGLGGRTFDVYLTQPSEPVHELSLPLAGWP